MNPNNKKSEKFCGVRVFVYKKNRKGYTTISIPKHQFDSLLRLAHLDKRALNDCAREASWNLRHTMNTTWSAAIVSSMFTRLRRQHIPALLLEAEASLREDERLAVQAVENNQHWENTI